MRASNIPDEPRQKQSVPPMTLQSVAEALSYERAPDFARRQTQNARTRDDSLPQAEFITLIINEALRILDEEEFPGE